VDAPISLRRLIVRTVTITLFAVIPVVMFASFMRGMVDPPPKGWENAIDFHMFWHAARALADGRSPYPQPGHFVISGPDQSFFYPASTAAILTPFAPLPYGAASMLFVVVLAFAVAGSLWMVGVRDWRCYGAVFASPAVFTAISLGTITPLLLLGVAATWRWRNRAVLVGVIVGLTVVAKLILWPLLIWLWFTRRRISTVVAVGTGALACLLSWAWIGFAGLRMYPDLLRHAEAVEGPSGYGLFWRLGGGSGTYLVVAAVAALTVGWVAHRRDDATSLAVSVLAALVATPQMWLHYLALLVVIAGVFRPRLNALWLLPLLLWITPHQQAGGSAWRIALVFLVVVLTAAWTVAHRSASASGNQATLSVAA